MHSKMIFVNPKGAAIFVIKKSYIDLKWREMMIKSDFGYLKWPPQQPFCEKNINKQKLCIDRCPKWLGSSHFMKAAIYSDIVKNAIERNFSRIQYGHRRPFCKQLITKKKKSEMTRNAIKSIFSGHTK